MSVDKKYIEAISNFADALEELVEALKSKETEGKTGDESGTSAEVKNTLTEISSSLDQIKSDTSDIKESTSETLKIAKEIKASQSEGGLFGGSDKKSKMDSITEGVGTILMIAGAVLAIGMAFQLVGSVDFASVVALSFALVAIGHAFATIAQTEGLDWKSAFMVSSTVVLMAAAITLSSWILSASSTITPFQFLSMIGIAIAFTAMSYGIKGFVEATGEMSLKSLFLLPLTMVAVALGITGASYIMSGVQLVSLPQMLTAIGIAIVFSAVGFGMGMFLKGIKDASPADILMLPIVMVAIAAAIVGASYILPYTQPMTLETMANVILTSLTLAIATTIMALPLILIGKFLDTKQAIVGGLTLLALVYIIQKSSEILAEYQPMGLSTMVDIVLFSAALAVSTVITSIPIFLLTKLMKLGYKEIIQGGLSVIMIATVIMASSHILSVGNYTNVPSLEWTLGAVATILAFTIPVVALGLLSMTGVGLAAIAVGAGAALIVAGTIMATSHILAQGNYKNGPSLEWAGSTALLLGVYAAGMATLGGIILASFGLGAAALAAGAGAVIMVANTIVETSKILATGTYTGGPTEDWARGISLAIGAFAPVFDQLNKSNVLSIFGGGGMSGEDYANVMTTIANSIIGIAGIFNMSKIDWANAKGPTKEWAEGISSLVSAFAPVFATLDDDMDVDEEGAKAYGAIMKEIAWSVLDIGWIVSRINWEKVSGPTKEWSEGIASSITAFGPIFKEVGGWFGADAKELGEAMVTTVQYLGLSALTLSMFTSGGNIFDPSKTPSVEWADSMGSVITKWSDFLTFLEDEYDDDDISDGHSIAMKIAQSIGSIGLKFGEGTSTNIIKGANSIKKLSDSFKELASSINTLSTSLGNLEDIDLGLGTDLIIAGRYVNEGGVEEMVVNQKQHIEQVETDNIKEPAKGEATTVEKTLDDIFAQMENLNQQISSIVSTSTNMSDYVDELRTKDSSVGIGH
jgi:hypothetical protein